MNFAVAALVAPLMRSRPPALRWPVDRVRVHRLLDDDGASDGSEPCDADVPGTREPEAVDLRAVAEQVRRLVDALPSAGYVRARLAALKPLQIVALAKVSGVPANTLLKIRNGATSNPGIKTVAQFLPHVEAVRSG